MVKGNMVYVGIAAVVVYFLWRKKFGGASLDTIVGGGIPLEEQAAPGNPESNTNPWDNADAELGVAIGPLVIWLADLRVVHSRLVRDVSQSWFPSLVRNDVVGRLVGWRTWIDNLYAASSRSVLLVSDFAAIANAWVGHMYWLDNVGGHGHGYDDNERRHAEIARDNARAYIEPVVNQYNNLDDNLMAWYENYGRYFQELYGDDRPVSHLEG